MLIKKDFLTSHLVSPRTLAFPWPQHSAQTSQGTVVTVTSGSGPTCLFINADHYYVITQPAM